jgi:hypothetical protein
MDRIRSSFIGRHAAWNPCGWEGQLFLDEPFRQNREINIFWGEPKEENEPQINATERREMDEHSNSGNESNGR